MSQRLVHLVYIHGFRGDETTFQTFPTHVQQYLTTHIPSHLNIKVQSSLYPTYKSIKPISSATKNFIEWLQTQPPGPVILLAHSMGGLLAAEAANDPSTTNDVHRRIVGLIAFDCPYLGMHPHVVVTGIASLFPKKTDDKMKTEAELNPSPDVRIVDRTKETENWEDKQDMPSPSHSSTSLPAKNEHFPKSDSLINRTMKFISSHSDDPLVRWTRKHSDEPFSAGKRWVMEHFQFGSCMFDPSGLRDRYVNLVSPKGLFWVNYWTITTPKEKRNASHNSEDLDRQQLLDDNNQALIRTGIANPSDKPSSSFDMGQLVSESSTLSLENAHEESALLDPQSDVHAKNKPRVQQKQKQNAHDTHSKAGTKAKKKEKGGRHFVVLPTGLGAILGGGDHWEPVVIEGVDDEVAAHCGLFIPEQNLEYAKLVERVGHRIIEWCDKV
ncbi:hypothetical protein GGU10DRAFT_392285 [Lentinula aff. detonsa]|uniref:AB hydrolase-1 domain-containing protein n=1 Tax=Lentinula aff. detonsa TaxID=2804958 RepID=A0AA38NS48_9AGAR|nr:hypothetical protein GGU10DRAFT_392285 [Lentinula aff. detonsa]